MQATSASLSLQLPHSDLSFVESDSDGEWSGTVRRRSDSSLSRKHRKNSNSHPIDNRPGRDGSVPNFPGSGSSGEANQGAGDDIQGPIHRLNQLACQGLGAVCNSQASDVATKLLWLSVFHSAASRRAVQFECTAVLGPWVVRFCTFICRVHSHADLPRPLPHIVEFLDASRLPAMISLAYQGMRWLFRNHPPLPQETTMTLAPLCSDEEQLRQSVAAMNVCMDDLLLMVKEQEPKTASDFSRIFKPVVNVFKGTLDRHQIENCRRLAVRFDNTDAEWTRYLLANHLLEARTNEDIEKLFRVTSQKLQESVLWYNSYHFLTERVIKGHWSELVCWTKRIHSGHPVLLVRLGAAIRSCQGEKAEEYSRAIVTQVDRGVRKLLKNSQVDKLVTLVDCDGASTAHINRIYSLLCGVPLLLNKHYPGRLENLYMVNVPMLVGWTIEFVKRFLHPITQKKILLCGRNLQSIPAELRDLLHWIRDQGHLPSSSGSQQQAETIPLSLAE